MKLDAREYFQKKLEAKPDAKERVVNQVFDITKIKKIHLTGVCGKAMASLAGLLVAAGYKVSGSDESWNPPMSTVLEHLGLSFQPFSKANVDRADLVVMGNAYSPSNIEAVVAREKKTPQISSAQAYADFFIKNARSIVIAGTHGKTTTSGLAAHVFIQSGRQTNALIGGIIINIGESYFYAADDPVYSVVEGDEYDTAYFDKAPKFLHYRPTIGVITSIEFDHADIYTDMEDYLAAFVFFAQEIPPEGYLLVSECVAVQYQMKIKAACNAPVYVYGFSPECDIRITDHSIDHVRMGQWFSITLPGKSPVRFFTSMFGKYNVDNAASVAAIALREGIDEGIIRQAVETFKGTEQRQQTVLDKEVTVISDFAHHPTAVQETIGGIRDRFPERRIIAVFEPRSTTSRRKDFEAAYSRSFDKADVALISTPPIKSVDDPSKMMDIDTVVSTIGARGVTSRAFLSAGDILLYLQSQVKKGDIILVMSNGTFDNLVNNLVAWLENPLE